MATRTWRSPARTLLVGSRPTQPDPGKRAVLPRQRGGRQGGLIRQLGHQEGGEHSQKGTVGPLATLHVPKHFEFLASKVLLTSLRQRLRTNSLTAPDAIKELRAFFQKYANLPSAQKDLAKISAS